MLFYRIIDKMTSGKCQKGSLLCLKIEQMTEKQMFVEEM